MLGNTDGSSIIDEVIDIVVQSFYFYKLLTTNFEISFSIILLVMYTIFQLLFYSQRVRRYLFIIDQLNMLRYISILLSKKSFVKLNYFSIFI